MLSGTLLKAGSSYLIVLKEPNGKYLVDGSILLETFNAKFGTQLMAEDADTLSGYLVEQLGHKIKQGKQITLEDAWTATLQEVQGIRTLKVRISKVVQG